jgi:hypothetical protein
MRDAFRASALAKKLLTAEHAWELIGLAREAWDEHERLGEFTQADWRLCEELHAKYRVIATPTTLTQHSARVLLRLLEQRRLAGLASPRQVYYLRLYGLSDERATAEDAKRALTRLWEQDRRYRESVSIVPQRAEKHDDWLQAIIDGRPEPSAADSGPTRRFDFSIEDDE